ASISPTNVCFTASSIKWRSLLLFCCSRICRGLEKLGSISERASNKIFTCAFWQPRLKIVAPSTLGLAIYPANKRQRVSEFPRSQPHPPSCVKNLIPSTLGKTLFCLISSGVLRMCDVRSSSVLAPFLYWATNTSVSTTKSFVVWYPRAVVREDFNTLTFRFSQKTMGITSQ